MSNNRIPAENIPSTSFFSSSSTRFFNIIKASRAYNWQLCRGLGLSALGVGHAFLRDLQKENLRIKYSVDTARGFSTSFSALGAALDKTTTTEENKQEIENLLDNISRITRLNASFDSLALDRNRLDWAIANLSRGLQALLQAEYNLVYAKAKDNNEFPLSDALLSIQVQQFQKTLRERQLSLYKSCVKKDAPATTARKASNLAREIELQLPAFVGAQARGFIEIRRRLSQSQGGAAEKLASILCQAGGLTREAITCHAAAYKFSSELLSLNPEPEFANLHTKAASKAFEMKLPNGKNAEIAKVSTNQDGDFLEVLGLLIKIKVLRQADGKLISQLLLYDPSSKKTFNAVGVFTNLAHVGLTPGAFCRLHGTLRRKSNLFDNKPAIEVMRLSQKELAEKAWLIAFLRSARPWFHRWRNGIHLDWTLIPHVNKSEEEDFAMFGANEIIFSPLIRN